MSVIDTEGRLFGRFNLVDAVLVVLLVAAIPAGYGAYLMFRDPPARLVAVMPTLLTQAPVMQVEIRGANLRPYMRVSFGTTQAPSFLFYGPTSAFVPLPPLAPGTYDVVLFDYMREVARLPNALTIAGAVPPATVQLQVTGAFSGIKPGAKAELFKGLVMLGPEGLIATIQSAEPLRQGEGLLYVSAEQTIRVPMPDEREVPATLLLTCQTRVDDGKLLRCWAGGRFLAPAIHIPLSGSTGDFLFRVEQIAPPPAPAAEGAK